MDFLDCFEIWKGQLVTPLLEPLVNIKYKVKNPSRWWDWIWDRVCCDDWWEWPVHLQHLLVESGSSETSDQGLVHLAKEDDINILVAAVELTTVQEEASLSAALDTLHRRCCVWSGPERSSSCSPSSSWGLQSPQGVRSHPGSPVTILVIFGDIWKEEDKFMITSMLSAA